MTAPSYTLPTGVTISSGNAQTSQIPTGYSFDASGKLTNAQGQEYTTPTSTPASLSSSTTNPVSQPIPNPIQNPAVAPTVVTGTPTPALPTPTAPGALQSFFGSTTAQVATAQQQADQQLAQRQTATQTQLDALNKQQSDLSTLQSNGMADDLSDVQKATQEKQDALTLEQQQYENNYNLNQGFLTQMQALVIAGNNQIEQIKELPIASTILTGKTNQTISDIAAQVGSLQTLMSAANGQMAAAKTQLDTTVATVSSVLQDQVDYYTSLQSFYKDQSTSNESQIATLTADQKTYLDQQLSEAQSNLVQVQKNAQALADAMTNPDTALAYNQAGVTVNDTPEQINTKLATYAYSKELSTQSQTMAGNGYTAVIPGQSAPAGSTVTTVIDSKGVSHSYYKAASTNTATAAETQKADTASMAQVIQSRLGSDGYLSPQDYATAKNAWIAAGYKGSDFDDEFSTYRNPSDTYQTG